MVAALSPASRPFRMVGPEPILRELRSAIELSSSWPVPERFLFLDVFGIGWIDSDSGQFLEWSIYASTSEPPVRPGSHPFVTHRVTLLFDEAQKRVDPSWFDTSDPVGPYLTLARAVPLDLQRRWRADVESGGPSLPVEVLSDRDFAEVMRRGT